MSSYLQQPQRKTIMATYTFWSMTLCASSLIRILDSFKVLTHTKAAGTSSFAIRISGNNNFFQLHVHHQCNRGCFEWESVIYSHGDIWHIIGSTVTRSGTTINDTGLHARIKEIEATNKKDSLLLLTSDSQEMMESLYLDCPDYEKGSSSLDILFEWAVAMPLFRRKFFAKETSNQR